MTFSAAILLIFITAVSASYGWGMRGAVIGGEKGAMIPGAFIGLSIALFSGIPQLRENWTILAAAGSLGMGFGGFEPYAETADFTLHINKDYYNPKKAFSGLAIKGANWFGIFGGILGITVTVLTNNLYQWYDFIVLAVLQVVVQLIGIKIFNKPFDKKKKIFPKIYYSRSSREEWGGNLLFLLTLIIYTIIREDKIGMIFAVTGVVAGGLGWYFSMLLCKYTANPLKNGKYVFGEKFTKKYCDNWKIMEFSFGAIGGLAFSLIFVAFKPYIDTSLLLRLSKETFDITTLMFFSRQENLVLGNTISYVLFFVAVLMPLCHLWAKNIKKKNEDSGNKVARFFELAERAVYYSGLLFLTCMGCKKCAGLVLFCLTYYVLLEETVFEQRNKGLKCHIAVYAVYIIAFILSVIGEFLLPYGYPLWAILVLYTAVYIISDSFYYCNNAQFKKKNPYPDTLKKKFFSLGSMLTVHGWFWILTAVILVAFLSGEQI